MMQKIIIEIETNDPAIVEENITGVKYPPRDTITQISENVNLHYQDTMHRKGVDVPSSCYFLLELVTTSLAGALIAQGVTWLFNKLNKLGEKVVLTINGRKTAVSEKAISEAIELAVSEPSIVDQIQKILSEVEQFSQTIIPLAHESRLHREEFFKGFPCAPLWGAHEFYLTIISSIEPQLEEIKRLENFCNGPLDITGLKQDTKPQS